MLHQCVLEAKTHVYYTNLHPSDDSQKLFTIGVPDHADDDVEGDDNGDGVPDDEEDNDNDGIPDSLEDDEDNDGIPDYLEDEDDDGIPDYLQGDANDDGILDYLEDEDDDGIPDYLDDDDDGDGVDDDDEGDDGMCILCTDRYMFINHKPPQRLIKRLVSLIPIIQCMHNSTRTYSPERYITACRLPTEVSVYAVTVGRTSHTMCPPR